MSETTKGGFQMCSSQDVLLPMYLYIHICTYIQLHTYISVSTRFPSDQTPCRSVFMSFSAAPKPLKPPAASRPSKADWHNASFLQTKKYELKCGEPQDTNYQSLVVSTFNPIWKMFIKLDDFPPIFVGVKGKQKMKKTPPGSKPWQKELPNVL